MTQSTSQLIQRAQPESLGLSRERLERIRSALESEIAAGKQVKWTMVPESTVKYAEFMHAVGTIKVKPVDWKELFFPEIHGLPGS